MNIFITVGTTPYDDLIRYCDTQLDYTIYTIQAQISDSALYQPTAFKSFAYAHDIVDFYEWADVVIAHAGAGTFYQLMEMKKKVILIPNTTMKDHHQDDICTYALKNNYAFTTKNYFDIPPLLKQISNHIFTIYTKQQEQISEYIFELITQSNPIQTIQIK